MRAKIIGIYAGIILLVGFIAAFLVHVAVGDATGNKQQLTADAKRTAQLGARLLYADGLKTERWLAERVTDASFAEVLGKASPSARGDAATAACDATIGAAKTVFGLSPALVVLTDEKGKVIGRNGTSGGRGDDLATLYAGFKEALSGGRSGSEIWANAQHSDQFLVSYVPLRDASGKIVGALAAGFTLNDEVSRVSEAVGRPLKLARTGAAGVEVLASSGQQKSADANDKTSLEGALTSGVSAVAASDMIVAGATLDGLQEGKKVALLAQSPASLIPDAGMLGLWQIIGAVLIGLILVALSGWYLSDYIDRPIALIEEGLLAIINGQTERRFGLEHAELGAVASRIDQLLNQLLGVEEDTTDEEGRITSQVAPAARPAAESGEDEAAIAQRLAGEPADAYYARLFQEYIAAKKGIGEATDHITAAAFESKIKQMEQDSTQKLGKAVRYRVQAAGKEVKLLAVTIG